MSIIIPAGLYHAGGDIETLQTNLVGVGGIIDIPAGIFTGTEFRLLEPNITFRGYGMWASTLTVDSGTRICRTNAATPVENIVFEDLAFDGAAGALALITQCVQILGGNIFEVTFRRCRFANFLTGISAANGPRYVTVEDCLAYNQGDNTGVFVTASFAQHLRMSRNRTRWVETQLTVDTGSPNDRRLATNIRWQNNESEGGWWLQKAQLAGSTTAAFTDTVLTDAGAMFLTTLAGAGSTDKLRIMPVLATGATTSNDATFVEDAGATFQTAGVQQGDIIRAGGAWAVVTEATTETVVCHEGWNDDTTFLPVQPPAALTAYTIYRVIIGETFVVLSDTQIQTRRWHDLRGNTITGASLPASGVLYEYTGPIGSHAINLDYGGKKIMVMGNSVRGHYGDQLAVRADDSMTIGNLIDQGQDMGITIWGERSICALNRILREGSRGILVWMNDSGVWCNLSSDSQQEQFQNDHLGEIAVKGADPSSGEIISANNNAVQNNLMIRTQNKAPGSGTSTYGLVLHGADFPLVGNVVRNNTAQGTFDSKELIDGDVRPARPGRDENLVDGEVEER